MTVVDTLRCNAERTGGCRDKEYDLGDLPGYAAIDPATHSVFLLGGLYNRNHYLDTRLCGASRC